MTLIPHEMRLCSSPQPPLVQILLVPAEGVADFVEEGGADFVEEGFLVEVGIFPEILQPEANAGGGGGVGTGVKEAERVGFNPAVDVRTIGARLEKDRNISDFFLYGGG